MLNEFYNNFTDDLTNILHFCGTLNKNEIKCIKSKLLLEYIRHYISTNDQLSTRKYVSTYVSKTGVK